MARLASSFLLVVILLFGVYGCGPTYKAENVERDLREVCRREFGFTPEVRAAGRTLGVFVRTRQPLMNEKGGELSRDLIHTLEVIKRVALSTDRPLEFCVVCAENISMPGVELVSISKLSDTKKVMFEAISRDEYLQRRSFFFLAVDKSRVQGGLRDTIFRGMDRRLADVLEEMLVARIETPLKRPWYTAGGFDVRDIALTDFIAEQMAQRIQNSILYNYALRRGWFKIPFVLGKYQNGSFIVSSSIIPNTERLQPQKALRIVEKLYLESIRDSIRAYEFKDFQSAAVIDIYWNKVFTYQQKELVK